jgi:integrase
VWKTVLARAGIQDLRIHDLRRTLGSWAAAGGVSLPIIGAAMGHHDWTTTQIYARLNLDSVRGAIEATVQTMLTVGGQGGASAPALPPARHRAGRL